MLVQIAGVKNLEDAIYCEKVGVDFIGLLVGQTHESSDFISPEKAKDITKNLKKSKSVIITHLEEAEEIIKLAKKIGCYAIQLHSNINEIEVEKIVKSLPKIKLLRLIHISIDGKFVTDYTKFKYVDWYFIDTFNPETNQAGGTGLKPDWNTCKQVIKDLEKPVFIAGGLNVDNLEQAIKIFNPSGVDVNSGTKNFKTGNRDKIKVKNFTKIAKNSKVV